MKILKFYTDTCENCKKSVDILKDIEADIENINALENVYLVDKYNIFMVPALIFLDDSGLEVRRLLGPVDIEKVKEILNEYQQVS